MLLRDFQLFLILSNCVVAGDFPSKVVGAVVLIDDAVVGPLVVTEWIVETLVVTG